MLHNYLAHSQRKEFSGLMDLLAINSPLAGVNVLIGLLIGSTGIGGLFLAPAMNLYAGIPIHSALPACMAGIVLTGITGMLVFGGNGTVAWRSAVALSTGAGPGAFLGAYLVTLIPEHYVQYLICVFAVLSGVHSLLHTRKQGSALKVLEFGHCSESGPSPG